MTYIISKDEQENRHRTTAEIASANLMPPMMKKPALDHCADCSECFHKLNSDAKERVKNYARHRTRGELTKVQELMSERP